MRRNKVFEENTVTTNSVIIVKITIKIITGISICLQLYFLTYSATISDISNVTSDAIIIKK